MCMSRGSERNKVAWLWASGGRDAQLEPVFSDSLSVSTPASAPVAFPSSWAAGICQCWGTCPSLIRRPLGCPAQVSLQHTALFP